MFLQTIKEEQATGRVAEIYERQKAQLGFVMEAAKCFTARPDLLPIYTDFSDNVRASFSLGLREWRLITLIAAKHIPSTYCSHVYSKQLIEDLGSKEAVLAVQRDFRKAGLSDKDVEMLAYAEAIAQDASRIAQADIDRLRSVGFSDQQICDIALCAAFRCYVSRFFDAVGAGTEAAFIDNDVEFRSTMTVGRPV
ncbi:carboxymuconolactone decarboxylase family protein [Microvirga sp. VF16]|uniref:carboxymuconolactone decarboxylase family protein n=1 Tax=Microvirga sp. VF16 TaxID=2807101 RepID=UPI00193CE9E1|nr:carboxymuconolactone decarboxylase family protein [Microvirga sp. VF16]QRM28180.1 carboxymuconolactone decarboxylase family protein [Microvirga sp. VF16]